MSYTKRHFEKVQEYAEARDKALIECLTNDTIEPFKAFIAEQRSKGLLPPCFEQVPDNVIAIGIRKMSLQCANVPALLKGQAVEWLTSRGYKLE